MIEVHEGPGLLHRNLMSQYLYDDFVQPISIPVWEARPCHYPATCRIDKVLLDLVESRKPLNLIGANEYEFANDKFPAVAALLNPQHHASSFPLTTTIVSVRHWPTLLSPALTQIFIESHLSVYYRESSGTGESGSRHCPHNYADGSRLLSCSTSNIFVLGPLKHWLATRGARCQTRGPTL